MLGSAPRCRVIVFEAFFLLSFGMAEMSGEGWSAGGQTEKSALRLRAGGCEWVAVGSVLEVHRVGLPMVGPTTVPRVGILTKRPGAVAVKTKVSSDDVSITSNRPVFFGGAVNSS